MAGILLSGGVDAAILDTETYWWHLARLRKSKSRAEAARHARSMAGVAARRCAALAGAPGVGDRDPVAWSDLSACLVRLAMALERDFTWTGCDPDDPADGVAHRAWKRLAHTITRSDFTVAWQPVGEDIEALAAAREDGSPALLREFTATQVAWAAAAVTEAPW
jgi:hypothetical protein